jgi:hypothetical protein
MNTTPRREHWDDHPIELGNLGPAQRRENRAMHPRDASARLGVAANDNRLAPLTGLQVLSGGARHA